MAEILLSLTIIGVVAAITLPSLTGNINERTWNTQRKALYARFSQAISLMPALNGFGTLTETESGSVTTDTAAETFITGGLAKVLKINNICDSEHLADCGIASSFMTMGASTLTTPKTLHTLNDKFRSAAAYGSTSYSAINTNAVAFETQNGESIVAYYNPACRTEYLSNETRSSTLNVFGYPQTTMCVNFIYDLNGTKGPNTVGKDIGIITVFNATDSIVVAPMPNSTRNATYESSDTMQWKNAAKACTLQDSESRIPNIDEASALLININLFNLGTNGLWTSTILSEEPTQAWEISPSTGIRTTEYKIQARQVRCIKR
ncbi:MAG: hypothetical protein NC390_08545 [Fusobacterium sp.]|nr:hypothetical protein [Fusobacterium sp.]